MLRPETDQLCEVVIEAPIHGSVLAHPIVELVELAVVVALDRRESLGLHLLLPELVPIETLVAVGGGSRAHVLEPAAPAVAVREGDAEPRHPTGIMLIRASTEHAGVDRLELE